MRNDKSKLEVETHIYNTSTRRLRQEDCLEASLLHSVFKDSLKHKSCLENKQTNKLGVVVHAYNYSVQDAEAGELP